MCSKFQSTGTLSPTPFPLPGSPAGLGPPRRTTNADLGKCQFGPNCMFSHDINKVAMCKEYLFTGSCAADSYCDLSHDPNPNRTPACIHFSRGNCTKPNCRYTHVKIDAAANVCRTFATVGYCEKGADCTERHVFECPDYANTGSCPNTKCHLPHVDRARQLRKAAGLQNAPTSAANGSSNSNSQKGEGEALGEDVDSDDQEDSPVLAPAVPHSPSNVTSFSQQDDFVRFDTDG